jgi:energy-coupling factor transport system ATP-binding protein
MNSHSSAIEVNELSFTYDEASIKALNSINISINKGQFIVFLGGSKSGKTTILNGLSGIIPHFFSGDLKGDIKINGIDIRNKPVNEICSLFSFVFQDFSNQLFSTSCLLEMAFFPENLGMSKTDISTNIHNALTMVGLDGFLERNPETLSGGEKQKLAIASILSGGTPNIGFDEARTDLDPVAYREIGGLFQKLKNDGKTIIAFEEEVDTEINPDEFIVLNNGKISMEGSIEDICSSPETLVNMGVKPPDLCYLSRDEIILDTEEAYRFLKSRKVKPVGLVQNEKPEIYTKPIVKVSELDYSYTPDKKILNGLNMEVYKGEWLSILGENGSGKTTLAKNISGLLKPSKGVVFISGEKTTDITPDIMVKKVGYLFQDPDHQIFCESVFDELAFGLKHTNHSRDEIEKRVRQILNNLNLQDYIEEDPYSLTKGERQKVALGSILVFQPEILILDEPTTGLDYKEINSMIEILKHLQKMGTTIISITHSMWFAGRTSDRIIVMKNGDIVLNNKPDEIFNMGDILKEFHISTPDIIKLSLKLGTYSHSIYDFYNKFSWEGKKDWKEIYI